MRPLAAKELLTAWERGLDLPLPHKALVLLSAAFPELLDEKLSAVEVGRRDRLLMQLRAQLFGPEMALTVRCPKCGAKLESTVRVSEIQVESEPFTSPQTLSVDGYRVIFRLPTSSDLIGLPDEPQSARLMVLRRCLVQAELESAIERRDLVAEALPEHVISAIAIAMSAADPQADLQLSFDCPSCAHHWADVFDIVSALWKEVHAWVERTVRDVHVLARAYGWGETEVLALSPTRRQMYLELSQQ